MLAALLALAVLLPVAGQAQEQAQEPDYAPVDGPCGFLFPRDHGPHPGHRTEWWYYTGNLRDEKGRRYGFQLTFFRRALAPAGETARWPQPASAWRTNQLWLAHAAVSALPDDTRPGRHVFSEAMARGAVGLAGAEARPDGVTLAVNGWAIDIGPEHHRLEARADNLGISLELRPQKPLVAHGQEGYSRKGRRPESASCYYSFTRLGARGRLTVEGRTLEVDGLAWMDHEYSSALLEGDVVGWDWFSLQLDDGGELMVFFLRDAQGRHGPASAGSVIDPLGRVTALRREDLELAVTARWTSPHTGAAYPAGWRLAIPSLGLALDIRPALADQEMRTVDTAGMAYWEGAVTAQGTGGGRLVAARGYVELTGYAAPLRAPL